MKKPLALLLAAVMIFSLCACTGGVDPEDTVSPSAPAGESATVPPQDTTQEPSLALPSEEPSEELPTEPSDEPTAEPSAEPSQEPSEAPATQPPATQPPATQPPATQPPATQPPASQPPASQAPATQPPASQAPEASDPPPSESAPPVVPPIIGPGGLGGLGGGGTDPTPSSSQPAGDVYEPRGPSASDIDLEAFYESLLNSENYAFPDMDTPPTTEWLSGYIPGLVNIPVVQRLVYFPRATSNGVELVLVQVADSSDVDAVKSVLQAHIDDQAGGFNYPQVIEAWQNYARIVSSGDYIMLVVHSEYDAITAAFNALF